MAFTWALTFFCTRDLAACERFYGKTLGLEVAVRTPTAVLWRITDTAFFGVTAGPGRQPAAGAAIVDLVVASAAEVQQWYDKIVADGWETDGPPRYVDLGATNFFVTGPDGYLVEVHRQADGTAHHVVPRLF